VFTTEALTLHTEIGPEI